MISSMIGSESTMMIITPSRIAVILTNFTWNGNHDTFTNIGGKSENTDVWLMFTKGVTITVAYDNKFEIDNSRLIVG